MEIDIIALIGGAIGLVAAIWKGLDANFWKGQAKEIFEVIDTYKKATDESSPGGKKLTLEEKAKIGEESMDVIIPIWDKLAKKFNKKEVK